MTSRRIKKYRSDGVDGMMPEQRLAAIADTISKNWCDGSWNRDWLLVNILKYACMTEEEYDTIADGLGTPDKI